MKKVIVCDDDEGITEVAQIVLQEKGYNVITLNNSKNIINIIKQEKPALILLDLWMPSISGEEITYKIKGDDEIKNIPIVIFSASKDTKKVSKTIGANDFLTKPFNINELEEVVAKNIL